MIFVDDNSLLELSLVLNISDEISDDDTDDDSNVVLFIILSNVSGIISELCSFVPSIFCVLVNSFVLYIVLPGCCVISELVLYKLDSSGSISSGFISELLAISELVSSDLIIVDGICSEFEPISLIELSLVLIISDELS